MSDIKPVTFQTLYAVDSKGSLKEWNISVDEVEGYPAVIVTHGKMGGKMQTTHTLIKSGKNLGKANETSAYEQAISEASSKWTKQFDKNYRESVEEAKSNITPLPMLAHSFDKSKSKIKFPAAVQPKLDGIRCMATRVSPNKIEYLSRKGKTFSSLSHLDNWLLGMLEIGETFDGELYSSNLTFQEITSAVRKESGNKFTTLIEYHVYDLADNSLQFKDRLEKLNSSFETLTKLSEETGTSPIKMVETREVLDEGSVYVWHEEFCGDGFEGTMIRNLDSLYKFGHRSADLQKYKDFEDDEFTIIGVLEGVGKSSGQAILELETEDGKVFKARCKGTDAYREHQLENFEQYKGKKLTVRYQGLSDEGVPRFPVGIEVRDYE